MADIDLKALRALLDKATPGERVVVARGLDGTAASLRFRHGGIADVRRVDVELLAAAVNALPELLRLAEVGAAHEVGLVFGPWFEGERHAVAVDGVHYELRQPREGIAPTFRWGACWYSGDVYPYDGEVATESEAIAAAVAHDKARRGGR